MVMDETFDVRIFMGKEGAVWRGIAFAYAQSLEDADKLKYAEHTEQCTWEDIEDGKHKGSYSSIRVYRGGEYYNELYFIHPTSEAKKVKQEDVKFSFQQVLSFGNFIRDNYYVAGTPRLLSYNPNKYPHATMNEILLYWCIENNK